MIVLCRHGQLCTPKAVHNKGTMVWPMGFYPVTQNYCWVNQDSCFARTNKIQFYYQRPVLAFGYWRCLRLSVSPSVTKFVHAITHYPFKLGSPNLDPRCKRPCLKSLLFCGTIYCDLQGQIELQSQNVYLFELVHAITHHQLKLQFSNLEQKCILALLRSLPNLGLIEIDLQFNF